MNKKAESCFRTRLHNTKALFLTTETPQACFLRANNHIFGVNPPSIPPKIPIPHLVHQNFTQNSYLRVLTISLNRLWV